MKLSGEYAKFEKAGISIMQMIEVNGFPKSSYSTVTCAMWRVLKAEQAHGQQQKDADAGE
jgi:hypothetical protein